MTKFKTILTELNPNYRNSIISYMNNKFILYKKKIKKKKSTVICEIEFLMYSIIQILKYERV